MNEPNLALERHPFLVVSDIHADAPALERVLEMVPDVRYRCSLGDVIGYSGHNPERAVDLVDGFNVGIRGNHDTLALGKNTPDIFNDRTAKTVEEHAKAIGQPGLDQLAQYAKTFKRKNMLFVHGSPESENDYLINETDIKRVLEENPEVDLMFGGHLHFPRIAEYDKKTGEVSFPELTFPLSRHFLDLEKKRYVVNVPAIAEDEGRMGYKQSGGTVLFHQSETNKVLNIYFLPKEL